MRAGPKARTGKQHEPARMEPLFVADLLPSS
jgi:hypothetical protein